MRAALSRVVGGPESLTIERLPDPRPRPGEIVIDVKACGVNYPDALIIEDRYQFKPARPFSPGSEVAGIVSAVAENVTERKIGERVIGWCNWGGMAERIALPASRCIPIPEAMPFDEASALMTTYGTSHYALRFRGQIRPGETLLVLGAAGGVGLAAVQLGKAMGARVIAAASSADKVALAKEHGAAAAVVYPRGPFDKAAARDLAGLFKSVCGEYGADVIYDGVGGDYAEAALRAIAWDGRFLVVGFPAGIPRIPLNLPLLKSCQIVGVFWGAWIDRDPQGFAASIKELTDFYRAGAIKPLVSKRFPLEKAADAISWLTARQATGKVVVTMEHGEP
jgi:NADPH2:quinone reductase